MEDADLCSWSAICRGATIWGLEHSSSNAPPSYQTITSRKARFSYGICLNHEFDSMIHREIDKYWDDIDGMWRARNQMSWLAPKVSICNLSVREVYTKSSDRAPRSPMIRWSKWIFPGRSIPWSKDLPVRESSHLPCTIARTISPLNEEPTNASHSGPRCLLSAWRQS